MVALADGVLHPANPYPDADRVILPFFIGNDPKEPLSMDVRFRAIRDGVRSYDRIAGFTWVRGTYIQTANTEEYRSAIGVSAEFFGVLGVRPIYGRALGPTDSGEHATQVAVISYRLWNRLFRDRPTIDGLTIDVARTRYTIVGVMPRGFHFPYDDTDIWLPLDALPADPSVQRFGPQAVLHLRPGVTLDAARAELTAVAARVTRERSLRHPLSGRAFVLAPAYPRQNVFPSFVFGTVAMVLIIASANLATMLVARGMARRRDTAIRVALGASRRDVVRGTFCECALIVIAGLALGMLLTAWSLYVLPHFTIPMVPDLGDMLPVPSWRVFLFAAAVAVVTIAVAGILPALRAASVDPSEPMKEGSGTSTGRVRDRYNVLIVVEVALSTALLMCSGMFATVAIKLAAFDFRYAAKQLLTTSDLHLYGRHLTPDKIGRTYDDVVGRVAGLPHVRSAATTHGAVPVGRVMIAENGRAGERWLNSQGYSVVSPDYFRTMGISAVRGRDFLPGDAAGARPVAIVDMRAVVRLWPDVPDPVGRMLKLGAKESPAPWVRVIGVIDSIEFQPRSDIDLPPEPGVYVVQPNDAAADRSLLVRGDGVNGDRGRAELALAVAREIDAMLPELHHVTLVPWLNGYEAKRDASAFMASLFGAFAAFGLVLCAVGLYGVLAYTVSRRIREFAVRFALGARRRDVLRVVAHDAAVMALAGVGVGAFLALEITRPIIDLLAGYPYATVIALIGAELILFTTAFVAALGPLRQAARADPIEVLRAA